MTILSDPVWIKCYMIDSTANPGAFPARSETHNKYGAYLFGTFLAEKTALPEVSADWLF